jgi:signal transduction histidine kinase
MYLPEKSIEYSEKVIALDADDAYALYELGAAYSWLKQHEKEKEYFEKTLEVCIKQNNLYLLEVTYCYLADNALTTYDLYGVETYLNKVLEICGNVDNMYFGINYLITLGNFEKVKGNFAKSEKIILQALELTTQHEALDDKRVCYMVLAELAIAQHKFRESIQYLVEMNAIEVEIASATTLRAAEEMSAKYETEKKQRQIENQKQIIGRRNMQRNLFASGVAVSIAFLFLLWYLLHLRSRRNLALTERNDALLEMNATKDKFFSIISHDLKNPAIAQREAIQMLANNGRSWSVDALTEYYGHLLKSADSQVELLYNLLNWAQVQTGRISYTPVEFNLSTRLRTDLSLIGKMAENKGVVFTVEMPDDAFVTGDLNMLITVIRNLLTNAVKFTSTPGEVSLTIKPVAPSRSAQGAESNRSLSGACTEQSRSVEVTIRDTGVGMNQEQLNNLFSLQTSRHRKGTADEQGSGLGLIVCKEMLEKHGSALHVESEESKGSTFWFTV